MIGRRNGIFLRGALGAVASVCLLGSGIASAAEPGTIFIRQDCALELAGVATDGSDPRAVCYEEIDVSTVFSRLTVDHADEPVTIDIGPGVFIPKFGGQPHSLVIANHTAPVTIRGAGSDVSTLRNERAAGLAGGGATGTPDFSTFGPAAVLANLNSVEIRVSGLRLESAGVGIQWIGTGSSVWHDVDVVVDGSWADPPSPVAWAWNDYDPSLAVHLATGGECPTPMHRWYDSSLTARSAYNLYTVFAACGTTYFVKTPIVAEADATAIGGAPQFALRVNFGAVVEMIASDLSIVSDSGAVARAIGASAFARGEFNALGGSVTADTAAAAGDAVALEVEGDSTAALLGTAVDTVASATSSAHRTWNSPIASVPGVSQIIGVPDADLSTTSGAVQTTTREFSVQTACDSNGVCGAGTEAHLFELDDAQCTTTRWFDTVTGMCLP